VALPIPSLKDIYNKIKSSIFSYTAGELEVEKDKFCLAMTKAQSETQHAMYKVAQDSVDQTFAQTATDESFLTAIAFDKTNNEIRRNEASTASGKIVVAADVGVEIPAGTQFLSSDGEVYESIAYKISAAQSFTLTSLVRTDNYAVGTLADNLLGNGMTITFSGANETAFNGAQEIEILTSSTFRYANTGSNETATGTITGTFNGCRCDVTSVSAAESANQTFTDVLTLIDGIDDVDGVYITYDGIYGGTDIESLEDFKERLIEFLTYPQNKGNRFQHQSWIKAKSDVNYAYTYQSEDDFYIYVNCIVSKLNKSTWVFTNLTNDELVDLKALFIANNQLALGCSAVNLSFVNPTFVNINITITGLSPATNEMKTAINILLKEYIARLPIKYYLSAGLSELLADKLKQITYLVRDGNGTTPSITNLTVSGASGLDSNNKKPILGTITYS
jgi:uncharacterized phage protein gp47/JayE